MCNLVKIFIFITFTLLTFFEVFGDWNSDFADLESDFLNWDNFFDDWDNFHEDPDNFIQKNLKSDRSSSAYNAQVNYFTNLVTQMREQGQYFQLPTDASVYKSNDNFARDFGYYDFIIIGAGAGGSLLANRLSEIQDWKILLIEAGGYPNNVTSVPNLYFEVEYTEYNWGFVSVPQKTACLGMVNRTCAMARGRGLGGTTLVNGLVYSRGSSLDFDRWANVVQDNRWSYKNVLPVFKRTEKFNHRDEKAPVFSPVHGKNGLLNVEYHLPRSPQLNAWLDAHRELNLPIADYNAGTGLGASPAQINTLDGRTQDAGTAFILPILNRKNLHIVTYAYVTKILVDENKTARGVIFTYNGRKFIAKASKEVIVSAGTFQTPQILMLSGIGPKKHLKSLGIPVIQDLEVGTTLRDHACFYGLTFATNYTEPILPVKNYVEQFLKGVGPFTSPGNNQGVAFYESRFTKGTGYPDIEIMFIPANATNDLSQRAFRLTDETYEDVWQNIVRAQSFVLYITSLHSDSIGTVRLKSKNPFDYPVIDNRFLSDPGNRDLERLYEGIQIMLRLARTKSMQKLGTTLQGGPLRACTNFIYQSRDYWECAIRQMSMNLYHPVGSTPMGPNPLGGDVVDSECKVYGIRRLRVVDGSVFPFTLAGHPMAAVALVAEMASDFIKEDYLNRGIKTNV